MLAILQGKRLTCIKLRDLVISEILMQVKSARLRVD